MRLLFFESLDFLIRRFTSPRSKDGPTCYIDKLPNDILVDEVFSYLDVFDILRMRQVSKLYYHLTHHPAIWKRLLQRTDVPLPPVAPSSRNSLPNLNGYEVERIVLRATSLDHSWKREVVRQHARCWTFQTLYDIQSMVLLPGSQYLVASVLDKIQHIYSIVVFAMDTKINGSFPLAKTATGTKAYHLQAKYMTIQGERGIVISYVRRYCKHFENVWSSININAHSAEHEIDSAMMPKYECVAFHVSLSSLDILGDPRLAPGSEEFLAHAKTQPPPFRLLATIRTGSVLGIPALDEVFGSPYLAVPKGSNAIIFKKLDGGSATTLHCNPTSMGAIEEHFIVAIRLVTAGNKVLVVRKVGQTEPCDLVIEYYDVIPSDTTPSEVYRDHIDAFYLVNVDAASVTISDHGIPPQHDDSIIPSLYDHPEAYAPRPISIYITWPANEMLLLMVLAPKRNELPPTPLSVNPDTSPTGPSAQLTHAGAYAGYSYPLPSEDSPICATRWDEPGTDLRVLPGSYRAIVYTVPRGDDTDAPHIVDYFRYCITPESRSVPTDAQSNDMLQETSHYAVWMEPPEEVEVLRSVQALAWDETIGRLCICGGDGSKVHVLDFAKAPLPMVVGDKIERYPVPVRLEPNPDAIAAPLAQRLRDSSSKDNSMDVDGPAEF